MTTTLRKVALGAAAAALALLAVPAAAMADQRPVTPPAIPGVAPLPGPVVPAATPAATMQVLKTVPDTGIAGKPMTISGTGLPANKQLSLVWMTANVSWVLDARSDSVDYIGRQVDKFGVELAKATTDASGSFTLQLKVPRDFGGLHDMFAVADGKQLARGGYLIERRMTISPKRGPVGTPIHISVTGLGSPLYDSGGAIYYDNHYTGVFTGNTTRGEASFVIRAAGSVGRHQIVSGPAITVDYLNPLQSPQPWQPMFNNTFTVTKDAGRPATTVDWPVNVAPTIGPSTTLSGVRTSTGAAGVTAQLSATSGAILSKVSLSATGLAPSSPVNLIWATVVGNRVNCTGQCWALQGIPLAGATAGADGSLSAQITVPDNLGGWHMVRVMQGDVVKAEVPFFVTRSLVAAPKTVKQGEHFQVHLKGVGWTQLDNTVAVTYDNSYVGYGCGFNSNGDVVLDLVATGDKGTHLIDLYPLLYTQNPPYLNAVYGMVPFLAYAREAPGLALGYKLPAIRLAITVV